MLPRVDVVVGHGAGGLGLGATIIGRNMFGPVRGPWGDSDWKGWWGDEPPYHHPVFVLTHHPPIEMEGGTTFHFGGGERLVGDLDADDLARYECVETISSPAVTHLRITRKGS